MSDILIRKTGDMGMTAYTAGCNRPHAPL